MRSLITIILFTGFLAVASDKIGTFSQQAKPRSPAEALKAYNESRKPVPKSKRDFRRFRVEKAFVKEASFDDVKTK